ncbi:MAG: DNA polymerase III subunit gamma/tau [Anaerolineae bacterium]
MNQALYLKWRPQTFDDVVAQAHIVRTLRNALRSGHVHHAYLFAGPRGTGKTTTARLIAKAVNCLAPVEERPCNRCEICNAVNEGRLMDLIEIDAASHTGVDNVRDILEKVNFRPTQARTKVYVIDEVHMLSTAAFNALLKTLEEPPVHVIFVLATTEVHKIPPTVLSRCQRFEFRRIPLDDIVTRLKRICEAEEIEAEAEALDLIARAATGSLRDAISLLDQLASDGTVTAEYVRQMLGSERRETVLALARAWLDEDLGAGIRLVNQAVDGGADPRQLARQVADFLRGLLLMRLGAGGVWTEPMAEERPRFQALARRAEPERLVRAVHLFSEVAAESQTGWQPQLPLELAFVEATLSPPEPEVVESPVARPKQRVSEARSASSRRASTATAPEQAEPAPTEEGATALPVEEIEQRWKELLRQLSPPMAAPLWSARPLGVADDGALVLGFRHTFHRNKAQEEAYKHLEDLLSQVFHQAIRVRCVLEEEWEPPSRSPRRKAASAAGPEAAQTSSADEDPPLEEKDEVVRRAVEELGAVPKAVESGSSGRIR